jgi:hypothetical protein
MAAAREAATLVASFAMAEVFYKFHSFTLECLAFLATWVALSSSAELAGRLVARARGAGATDR